MLVIKSINLSILCALLSMGLYVRPALAKPISNTLKATVSVANTSGSIGEEGDNNYVDINSAIENLNEGGILKIKSGEYKLESIINKNVILECADIDGFVDIITELPLPAEIKIKVGERVTINQEDENPVNLLFGIYNTAGGSLPILSKDEIRLNVRQDEEVIIKVGQEIKNRLGFHDLKVMLKVNNAENVIVSRSVNSTNKIFTPDAEGIYNLDRISEYANSTLIKFNFTSGGEYIIELWADDGR